MRSATGHGEDGRPSVKLPKRTPGDSGAAAAPSDVPASIRFSWLIPVFVIGAFACALLTLLGSLASFRVAKIASTVGAVSAVLALVHLALMNSSIHDALAESVEQGTATLKGSVLGGLAEALGNALVNSFELRAGAGLYLLVVSLVAAALLVNSRLLSRVRSAG